MKRIAWNTTLVLITISGLVLLWVFRQALVLFLLSLAISAALHPLIDYMVERSVPRGAALVSSYLLVIGGIAGLLWLMGGPLVREIEQLSNQAAISYEETLTDWQENGAEFQRSLAGSIPRPDELFVSIADGGSARLFQGLMGFTTNLAGYLQSLGLVIILSLYWSADRLHFERLLLSLIHVNQRTQVRMIWRGIEKGVGAYIRSELFQSLLAGFLLWLGYRLMGLDYPVLLAVLGALAWLIPWFGAVIAMIPPLLVGASSDPALGVVAALYTLIVLVVQEFFIEPRIFRRDSYSAVILVIVILVLTDAFGLIGLILAPLLSATLQNIFKYLVLPSNAVSPEGQTVDIPIAAAPDSLRVRLEETKEALREIDQPPSLEIGSLIERLDQLIVESQRYFESEPPASLR